MIMKLRIVLLSRNRKVYFKENVAGNMFAGLLQPTDAQDDGNMWTLSYSTKSCAVCRFTSAFAGVKSTQPTSFKFNSNIIHMLIFKIIFLKI